MTFNNCFTIAAGATAFILAVTGTISAGNTLARYPSVRPVLTVPAQEELAAVALDTVIWAASPSTPPDIRLADAEDTPIPHGSALYFCK